MEAVTKGKLKKLHKIDWRIYVLFLPGFIYVSTFTFYPLIKMMVMSFFDWRIGYQQVSTFIGFENYIKVISDPIARRAIVNTLAYAVITVPMQMILGLFIAVLIHGIRRFTVSFRLAYYLPVITSWVVVALLFRYIYSNAGLLNYFLVDKIGIVNEPIGWLSTRWPALFAAMILGIWKGIGWNMIIFLAALQAVPKVYYEAASIMGLNKRQQFFRVTLPSIRGTILFAFIMLCIGAFNTYTPIAVLTNGNPAHQTEVVLTWMYYQTFSTSGKVGYAAALSVLVTIIIVIITVFTFLISSKRRDK